MGSTHMPFARNVQPEDTFPELGKTELARNRHGDRLGLLKPDPQVISRLLFTRAQSAPDRCRDGRGPDAANDAHCDYKKAPFFNVLAAFWIQFMTHDWFSHLEEGRNAPEMMAVGCAAAGARAAVPRRPHGLAAWWPRAATRRCSPTPARRTRSRGLSDHPQQRDGLVGCLADLWLRRQPRASA